MKCPQCSCEIETNQQRRQWALRARGLCIRCLKPSATWKCRDCTKLDNESRRLRIARKTGYEPPYKVHYAKQRREIIPRDMAMVRRGR
jgi:hypothetical protein